MTQKTCPNKGHYNDCHGTGWYWYDEDTPMAGQSPPGWRRCGWPCNPGALKPEGMGA